MAGLPQSDLQTLGVPVSSGFESVPDAFRAVAAEHADRRAIESEDSSVSYADLDRLSNRVANNLVARGGDQPVAMVSPLGPASIVVMLGALKAGRLFAPIDPRDPPDRLDHVRNQLGAVIVSSAILQERAEDGDRDPGRSFRADHPALVYFTSGSSGRLKGAIRSHGQLTSAMAYGIQPPDRFGTILPLAFAASITPVFETMLRGATICLFDPITQGLTALAAWLDRAGITAIKTSPSVLRTIATTIERRGGRLPLVRLAVIGGEPATGADLDAVVRVFPEATIINHYGSTEAGYIAFTVMAPGERIDRGPIRFRHIFPGQTVEVVDAEGRPVPTGDAGDLVVSGPYVALAYLPGTDPADENIVTTNGVRSIAIGDRGRFHADGTLEHLGRGDLRLKIRGQTVDPLVVERALAALPGVADAIVSAIEGRGEDARLIAHIVPGKRPPPSARELRVGLARSLPPFMIPAAFVRVNQIPRTPRGKADRDALRRSARESRRPAAAYVAPRNPRQQAIAEIVADLLGLERVSTADDLFDLGIDSLSVVELVATIRERVGVDLRPADLVHAPTVAELAEHLDNAATVRAGTIVPLSLEGTGAPLFVVSPGPDRLMFPARRLARLLNRPTYSFAPHGFAARARPDVTVERAAARYVHALRTIQPSGPRLIAGKSFGALIAYEMACQLAESGEPPALLVLIDPASGVAPVRRIVEEAMNADFIGSRGTGANRVVRVWRQIRRVAARRSSALADRVTWWRPLGPATFFYTSRRMKHRYRPSPYNGRTLLFRTEGWERFDFLDLRRLLTGEVAVSAAKGTHPTLLDEPQVADVAAILRRALGEAENPFW